MEPFAPSSHMYGPKTPGENKSKAKAQTTHMRLHLDSRDRDPLLFPNANDLRFHMAVPIRGVTSITLTDLWCPIATDTSMTSYSYVVPVLCDLPENIVAQYKEGTGYPNGVLGFLPLIPYVAGAGYTYHTSFGSKGPQGGNWTINFPFAMGQLSELHMQLWTWAGDYTGTGWGGPQYPPKLYPFAVESISSPPTKPNNYWITLEIDHQI